MRRVKPVRHKVIAVGILLAAAVFLPPPPVLADSSLGLSSPNVTEATINQFPFHYEDKFRVYNHGDEQKVIQIRIKAPYPDVREWLSVSEDLFILSPGTSKQITFDIDAVAGYGGDYEVVFTATMLSKEAALTGGAGAYLAMGVDFKFTIHVPPEVGRSSLGETHPAEELPLTGTEEPTPEKPVETPAGITVVEAVNQVLAAQSRIVFHSLETPLLLDVPSTARQGETVALSASFAQGGEPAEMAWLLTSPSGENFLLPRTATFQFTEVGTWVVLLTIGGEAILGQPVEVTAAPTNWVPVAAIASAVVVIGLLVYLLALRRRRH